MVATETKNATQNLGVFEQVEKMGHEQIVFCHDEATGLKAIIGVHNTTLGPSLGGTRMWQYQDEAVALKDVLRLSRGMTFKNSIAGLNLGGGKAVIIGDARKHKTEALLRAFGKFVENLNGKYITAEDVGMTAKDMEHISATTKHVSGMPKSRGGLGDPSPWTAYSTYMGMKAAAKRAYGSDSLEGKRVSVQGVGHVSTYLIDYLTKEGAEIFATDIYEDKLKAISNSHNVKIVGLDEIYDLDVDIYAPCALGATVNDETLERLKCNIICGCSNNQLQQEKKHGDICLEKGIIYAPDFLVNSGGVINVYAEVIGASTAWTEDHLSSVYDQTLNIINKSFETGKNTQEVAMQIALDRIKSVANTKISY